jgi:hypothetical protein
VLAIGINEDVNGEMNSRFARADAEAIGEALNFSEEDVRRVNPR